MRGEGSGVSDNNYPCTTGHKTTVCEVRPDGEGWRWFVRCTRCGFTGPNRAIAAEAVAAWNGELKHDD